MDAVSTTKAATKINHTVLYRDFHLFAKELKDHAK